LRNFESIGHDFASNGIRVAKIEGDPTGFTKEAFLWYLDKLGMYYLYLPLSVLFVFSLLRIFLSKSKDLLAKSWPFMLLFVVYYLIFSTLPNKDTRYIMPALVPLVIIISTLIAGVKNKILIYSLTMLILFIFILNNVSVAFGKYFDIKNRETILFGSGKLSRFGVVVSDVGGYTSTSPTKNICPLEEIVNIIPAGKMSRLIGDDEMRINNWDLAYFLPKDGRVWSGQGLPVLESDYLIFKDGPRNPVSLDTWDLRSKVTVLNTFTCTDGYKIYLTSVNK
jgi:hypothetical protein